MSSFNVKNIAGLGLCLLVLSGCGFHPMYANGAKSDAVAQYRNISIDNIPDRDGQYLRNGLIDKLSMPGGGSSLYTLRVVNLKKTVTDASLRKDATYTRGELEIDAQIQLIENSTNKVLLTRSVRSVGGYNLLDNQFATIVSEQTLTERALDELSTSIVTDLNLYFSRASDTAPK